MVNTDEITADDEAEVTDEQIEEIIRKLIEENLSEDFREAALEWLDKRMATYQAMGELQWLPDGAISSRPPGSSLDEHPKAAKKAAKSKTAKAARARGEGGKGKRGGGGG